MRLFHVLPHLNLNGGVKVALQHSHLLNLRGHDCIVTAPGVSAPPFDRYAQARLLPWDDARRSLRADDVLIYNWSEDLAGFGDDFAHRSFYFAQACFFSDPAEPDNLGLYEQARVLDPRLTLLSVSREVQRYFLYAFGRASRRVGNWIDGSLFHPRPERRVRGRVGLIHHRAYASPRVSERLAALGFEPELVRGSEAAVAQRLQTCEYFVSCSPGFHNGWRGTEGFQLPTAEAMACGCLTVSYDTGGCADYLIDGANGFLARGDDDEALVAAVLRARDSRGHAAIAACAAHTIARACNAETVAAQLGAALGLGPSHDGA
jgi:glycosyltransferase involved in cell wall biosynthesis